MNERKQHVRVDTDEYLRVIAEVGGCARLDDLAEHLGVSEATARRKLDGLVWRGQLVRRGRRPTEYGQVPA